MKAYKDQRGRIIIDYYNTFDEVAVELGYEEISGIKSFEDVVETEVLKDGKFLGEDEINVEFKKWEEKINFFFENPEEFEKEKWSTLAAMKEYIFIANASYRGGEKVIPVTFRIHEDPIEKVVDFYDWYDLWQIEFDMISAGDLYSLLKDFYEEMYN